MKRKAFFDVTETCFQLKDFDLIVLCGFPGSGKTGSHQLVGSILSALDYRRQTVVSDLDSHGYRNESVDWVLDLPMVIKNSTAVLKAGCRLVMGGTARNLDEFVRHMQKQFKVATVWLDNNPEDLRKVYGLRAKVNAPSSWTRKMLTMGKKEFRSFYRSQRHRFLNFYKQSFVLDAADLRFPHEDGSSLYYDTVFYSNCTGQLCDLSMYVSHHGRKQQRRFYGAFNLIVLSDVPRAVLKLINEDWHEERAGNGGPARSARRAAPPMGQERSVISRGEPGESRYSWRSRTLKISDGWRDDPGNKTVSINASRFSHAQDLWKKFHLRIKTVDENWRDPSTKDDSSN